MNLLVVLFFSTLTEAIIEYLFGSIQVLKSYLPILSLVVAVILTFAFQVGILTLLDFQNIDPFWDFLFSGIVVSRIANLLNDLSQKFLGSK